MVFCFYGLPMAGLWGCQKTYTVPPKSAPTKTPTSTLTTTPTITNTSTDTPTFTPTITATPTNPPTSTPTIVCSGSMCCPVFAQICVSSDDWSQVYVGGVSLGQVNYCDSNGTGSCPPGCLDVPMSLLSVTQLYVAVYTQNTSCNNLYASWDLDITCSNGFHSEITSANGNVLMDYVSSGNPSTPPASNWYATNYNSSGGTWTAPVSVNTTSAYCCAAQPIR